MTKITEEQLDGIAALRGVQNLRRMLARINELLAAADSREEEVEEEELRICELDLDFIEHLLTAELARLGWVES
jgi:hypothetical protein